jgi:hypothetical protein
VRWGEVVEADAVAAPVVEADVGRAGWVAPLLLVLGVVVYVLVVGTRSHTWRGSRATRKSAQSVARRWFVRAKRVSLAGLQRPVRPVFLMR